MRRNAVPASLTALLLLFVAPVSNWPGIRSAGPVGLTVDHLDRAVRFYTTVLQFEQTALRETAEGAADALLGLEGARLKTAELRLGDERLLLTEHLRHKGRPIPADSRSHDHWFQHVALVVSDIDAAYRHLRAHKIRHVSTAPQTLPAWNREAGGIQAFYFRDPEDHVLEIIWFPPGKREPKWQRPAGDRLFLGIDHTAIVVADTDRSLAFYRDLLGMQVAGSAENHGVEQEHLNQVFGARLRITALRAENGPGIELLEYLAPPGGRPLPPDARANDLVFWLTHLEAGPAGPSFETLRNADVRFVSRAPAPASNGATMIVRDPDGHALHITAP